MSQKRPRNSKKTQRSAGIADPDTVLAAAEKAPSVFNVSSYFRSLFVMRKKGYSWRDLERWLANFGIKISAVHLRRLYVQESARLASFTAQDLSDQGCPREMIAELIGKSNSAERLTAPDPEDAGQIEERRRAAIEYGVPLEEIERADLSQPIKLGGKTI